MVWSRNGVTFVLCVLHSVACSSQANPVARLLYHRTLPEDSVLIPDELTGDLPWERTDERPTYWVEKIAVQPSSGWRSRIERNHEFIDYLPDMVFGDYVLWRRPDPMPVGLGSVAFDAANERHHPMKELHTLGWWLERGEWVAELVIQPDASTPMDLCVSLATGTGVRIWDAFYRVGLFFSRCCRPALFASSNLDSECRLGTWFTSFETTGLFNR